MSLWTHLEELAVLIRYALGRHRAPQDGIRVVIYCRRPDQRYVLLSQARKDLLAQDAMDYDPSTQSFRHHGMLVEFREEEGR